MALKGKTTFELTDINTGEVEVIEDSNMITNGLQDFLATYGYFGCDVLSNDKMGASSLWVNALGGLFLFDSRLDENVENTFMPAGVKMIGNGSKDMSNSGAVTELGSYNTSESGLQSDGSVKFVYDFSTQQANGSIACACLTSKIGGYIGMGNKDRICIYNENYNFKTFISDSYHQRTSGIAGIAGSNQDAQHLLYPVYSENAIYFTNPYNIDYNANYVNQHWSTTKKIQILKVKAGFTSIGIKERLLLDQVVETYDIDIPQDILTYMGTNKYTAVINSDIDGNVYVMFCKKSYNTDNFNLDAGTFCWIMKIDREMNATAYKFTNNVGKTLSFSRIGSVFEGDYIWLFESISPYNIYGIKYTDSTQIIETGINVGAVNKLFVIEKNLIGVMKSYSSSSCYAPLVYDVINNELRQVNGVCANSSRDIYIPFIDKKGVYMHVYCSSSSSYFSVLKDPRYLATINNLSEPVVKTASKTMKVTYTITEA